MSRVLTPQPGDVDVFTVHPDGTVYVTSRASAADPRVLALSPELYGALHHGSGHLDGPEPACELRVRHGYPPAIEWSWNGTAGDWTAAPPSAQLTFLQWLARTVMGDATIKPAGS